LSTIARRKAMHRTDAGGRRPQSTDIAHKKTNAEPAHCVIAMRPARRLS
jgi:hypothetical protein